MPSPHTIEPTGSLLRRIVAGVAAVLVLASMPGVGLARFASADEDPLTDSQHELRQSKHELRKAKDRYRARMRRIRALQRVMNRLATRIARAESEIMGLETRLEKLQRQMMKLQVRAALLQAKLDERSREAYMSGGVPILFVLTATSAADAAARVSLLDEMNRRDAVLAAKVQETTDRVAQIEAEVVRARQIVEFRKRSLEIDRQELQRKLAKSRRLSAQLRGRIEQIQTEISLLRPLAVCPVDGPHAVADNFGAPRPEPGGGFHWHEGNDIMAASGTPIVAPFDGLASVSHSKLGGLGVYVHGDYGYVYNAHLSRLGKLGPVETGDVVGFVGSTGHSSGPHDHFEWHPTEIPPDWPQSPYGRAVIDDAINPFPPLSLVC
jgi:murein DD-endopeptidase MepM/ murein hydrolase activator NlpD